MFGNVDDPNDPCSMTNLSLYNNTTNISSENLGIMDDDYDIDI